MTSFLFRPVRGLSYRVPVSLKRVKKRLTAGLDAFNVVLFSYFTGYFTDILSELVQIYNALSRVKREFASPY